MVGQEIYNRGTGVDSGRWRSRVQFGCARACRPATARSGSARGVGTRAGGTRSVGTRADITWRARTPTRGTRTFYWSCDGSSHG